MVRKCPRILSLKSWLWSDRIAPVGIVRLRMVNGRVRIEAHA